MKQEKPSRAAVIVGTGADVGTGRAQTRRTKVIVRHRPTSVSVSIRSARSLPPESPAPLEPTRC
ncbi:MULTISPECIES: hypothetical protein [unclassified Streptomyces]|uniref:hypothetical protein n=1 Tax=unclassified Streptomyces TaxID=2593676 RepID=UPI002E2C761F|nr:hypothetical protein [Streptomyces sp. NBC_01439]